MLQLFDKLVKYLKGGEVTTDSWVFRLSSKYTALGLITCSILITTSSVIGDVIKCIVDGNEDRTKFINTYCWSLTTYTVPPSEYKFLHDKNYDEGRRYYTYYWWVAIVLFLQGVCCYLPKWLWDFYERNRLQGLVKGLSNAIPAKNKTNNMKRALLRYFLSFENLYDCYAIRYWFFEISSLVITLGQIVFMDHFMDGEFITYGFKVIDFLATADEVRIDPMAYTFPKLTKCEYYISGPSGSLQNRDALCLLPQNNMNEKVFVVTWFWFALMAILMLLKVTYLLMLMCCTQLRVMLLRSHTYQLINAETAETICEWADLTQLWMLYMVGVNIEWHFYPDLLETLAKAIEDPKIRDDIMNPSKDDPIKKKDEKDKGNFKALRRRKSKSD